MSTLQDGEKLIPSVLVVEDDLVVRMTIVTMVKKLSCYITEASNGDEAWKLINAKNTSIDVILLDREMPVMDGMQLVKKLKMDEQLRNIPIVMLTGSNDPAEVQQGIDAGVYYYLTKPIDETVLLSVLGSAVNEANRRRRLSIDLSRQKEGFKLMQTGEFKFKRLSEAESLACFLAACFPEPEKAVAGFGELLINAVEHGILGIGYDEKTALLEAANWRYEIQRREQLPDYRDLYVHVSMHRTEDEIKVVITDPGPGFDWRQYLVLDPARASDNHGRGIARCKMNYFDELQYNDKGNVVTVIVRLKSHVDDIDW